MCKNIRKEEYPASSRCKFNCETSALGASDWSTHNHVITSRPIRSQHSFLQIQEEKSSMSKTIPSIKIKIIFQIKQFIQDSHTFILLYLILKSILFHFTVPISIIQDTRFHPKKTKIVRGRSPIFTKMLLKNPHKYSKIWRNIQLFKYTKILHKIVKSCGESKFNI